MNNGPTLLAATLQKLWESISVGALAIGVTCGVSTRHTENELDTGLLASIKKLLMSLLSPV